MKNIAVLLLMLLTLVVGCKTIQLTDEGKVEQSISKLPKRGGVVLLPDRPIQINTPLIISKNNITLLGTTNTEFILSSNANCPVLVIGVQGESSISNIVIRQIKIDGNKTNQTQELWKYSEIGNPIYNNGIIIQNAHDILLDSVISHDCASGGLVTTVGTSDIIVSNYVAYNNVFDGFAGYETTNCYFVNMLLFNNGAAGISLDLNFNENYIDNVYIISNSCGIFLRNSHDNSFIKIVLIQNKQYDAFISSVDNKLNTGCTDNDFDFLHHESEIINNDTLCTNNTFTLQLGNSKW